MSRRFHARPWPRAVLLLVLIGLAAAPGVAPADGGPLPPQQRPQQAQDPDERVQDPDERVGRPEMPEDGSSTDLSAPTLMLTPSRFEARVGGRIRLTLSVLGADDLRRLPVTVRFDPAVVELIDVALGRAWDSRPQKPVFLHDASRPGELVVGLALIDRGRSGVSGFVELLDLEFRAIAPGDAALFLDRFAVLGGDGDSTADALRPVIVVR